MNRWITGCLFFVAGWIHAAPIGNTGAPDIIQMGLFIPCTSWIDVRGGYEGDFVADGRMEQFNDSFGRVDCYEQDTNSGTVTLNFLNRLDVFGVFGSSKTKTNWRFENEDGAIHRLNLHTDWNFLWAAGARAILYQWGDTFLGIGGRYSFSNYDPTQLTSDGAQIPVAGTFFHWREWQVSFDLSYKIKYFIPYIGFKYLHARSYLGNFSVPIAANGSGNNAFENREPVGLFLGCGLSNGHYGMINVEWRLIDEEAVTVSADLRF